MSWNIKVIRALYKKGFLVPFIKKYQPDILCLQETKAEKHQSEVNLPEYEEHWNSAVRKGYSGTAIFTKKNSPAGKPVKVMLNLQTLSLKNIKSKMMDTATQMPKAESSRLRLKISM